MDVKYLRQLKTGRIYEWTPILARRRDMVPYDKDTALKRIAALKREAEEKAAKAVNLHETIDKELAINEGIAKMLTELEATTEQIQKELEKEEAEEMGIIKKEPMTAEEIKVKVREERINNDKEIQKIRALNTKNKAEEYALRVFGVEIDREKPLAEIKKDIEEMQIARMFEGDD